MGERTYRFGEFTLNGPARELRRGDAPIALSPRAFDCLLHLIEHRDRAVGKDELIDAIWGRPNVSDTQLGQTVLRARRAIGDDGQIQHAIRTVSRYGYRWIADVAVDEGAVPAAQTPAAVERIAAAAPAPARDARAHRGRWLLAALAMLCAAFALYRFAAQTRADRALASNAAALVLPLRIDAAADSAWLRLGGMDLLAERLRDGGLAVPPSENVLALLRADANAADVGALRAAAPTALLVRATLAQRANGWSAELEATAGDGAALHVESSGRIALDCLREAADHLLERLGRSRPPVPASGGGLQERLQRAQAAMLANDLDGARAILTGDRELARQEPQLGYRLAQVDFRAGAYARAESSLTALLAEAPADDPLFRSRLLNARGGVRIRQDDYAGADADYTAAIALLGDGRHAPELGLALTGRGVTHAMRHDFAPALADLGAARVQLEAAGDALAVARVDSNLGGLEMNRDRPEQALPYLDAAAAQFERYGAINELIETLASLVSDQLTLLRPAAALDASDRSWTLAARVTDPNQRLNLTLDRIDVFLALGRHADAAALLGTLPEVAHGAPPFAARRLPALRARLALANGDAAAAAEQARHALELPAPGDDEGEGVAEIALVYQRAMLMQTPRPEQPPARAWVPARTPTYPVQAVLEAEWVNAGGDRDAAASWYRLALDLADRRGVPADTALVAASYAPWLLQRGRTQEAGEVVGRVSPWAERDFACALLEVRLFAALGREDAWRQALARAERLAGERVIPAALRQPPR
jgi:DNA-binding winged helix-turn-helix (wHTH) protein